MAWRQPQTIATAAKLGPVVGQLLNFAAPDLVGGIDWFELAPGAVQTTLQTSSQSKSSTGLLTAVCAPRIGQHCIESLVAGGSLGYDPRSEICKSCPGMRSADRRRQRRELPERPLVASQARPVVLSGRSLSSVCLCLSPSCLQAPGAVVRAGWSPEGLPIGVQIVAPQWREDIALAVAEHIDKQDFGGWRPSPLFQ